MKRNPRARKVTAISLATGGLLGIAVTASPVHALMRPNPCSGRSARRANQGAKRNPCQARHRKANPCSSRNPSPKPGSPDGNKATRRGHHRTSKM